MNKLVGGWIVATVGLSIIASVDGGHLASSLALAPPKIWHGELWRLVTWPFVERSISSALFKAYVIYQFAGVLVATWSARKLASFVATIAVLSALATCVMALVVPSVGELERLGGWTVTALLLIAVSRQSPDRELVWFGGPFRLKAKHGVLLVLALTLMLVVIVGPLHMIPELCACGLATAFPI
jgi:membrane associated rhomboid family serine protease